MRCEGCCKGCLEACCEAFFEELADAKEASMRNEETSQIITHQPCRI